MDVYTPEQVLAHMGSSGGLGEYTCARLVDALKLQKEVVGHLTRPRGEGESVTVAEVDTLILKWLKHVYLGLSALPGFYKYNLLTQEMGQSGLLQPFITKDLADCRKVQVGLPTNYDPDLICDTLSELVRVMSLNPLRIMWTFRVLVAINASWHA